MRKIVFATNNAHKLNEIRAILKDNFSVSSLAELGCKDDIPETANTLEGNALCKARYVWEHYSVDCFADDTGLEVEALGGQPGIFTARFGAINGFGGDHDAEGNTRCLLHKLNEVVNRKARFRTVIALIINGQEHLFEGIVEGTITTEKRGEHGFGYDPIFCPDGFEETFAEMGIDKKNRISHRARAVEQLRAFLEKNNNKDHFVRKSYNNQLKTCNE